MNMPLAHITNPIYREGTVFLTHIRELVINIYRSAFPELATSSNELASMLEWILDFTVPR